MYFSYFGELCIVGEENFFLSRNIELFKKNPIEDNIIKRQHSIYTHGFQRLKNIKLYIISIQREVCGMGTEGFVFKIF